MSKIRVQKPIVNMLGDEMAQVMWDLILAKLIHPYLDLELVTFDLGLPKREQTKDQVTIEAADAVKIHRVGVKCATITPNKTRVPEYNLTKEWKSPNATIRNRLGGVVFRAPITVKNISPFVREWKKPIVIARHAEGDIYGAVETPIPAGAKVKLVIQPASGVAHELEVKTFSSSGIMMVQTNLDQSIQTFARLCVEQALRMKIDLWFASKDTISKIYHGRFRDIFAEEVAKHEKEFKAAGIRYHYYLIDDQLARLVKHPGGFLLGLMNYEGDLESDLVASGFGSLGMMTSFLATPNGETVYEAAHGTVQQHFYRHQKGEKTSTNSVACIFAWTGALRRRSELDGNPELTRFSNALEEAVIKSIEEGQMTKDLTSLAGVPENKALSTEGFIEAVAARL